MSLSKNFAGNKPEPYKWSITEHGIVEHYCFVTHSKRNPPPPNWQTTITAIHTGYFHNGCWIAR